VPFHAEQTHTYPDHDGQKTTISDEFIDNTTDPPAYFRIHPSAIRHQTFTGLTMSDIRIVMWIFENVEPLDANDPNTAKFVYDHLKKVQTLTSAGKTFLSIAVLSLSGTKGRATVTLSIHTEGN
jgi:hypothetical protein